MLQLSSSPGLLLLIRMKLETNKRILKTRLQLMLRSKSLHNKLEQVQGQATTYVARQEPPGRVLGIIDDRLFLF